MQTDNQCNQISNAIHEMENAATKKGSTTTSSKKKSKTSEKVRQMLMKSKSKGDKNKVKDKTKIMRVIVLLEDSKPGHQLWIGDKLCYGKAGQYFGWEHGTKHMAANLGETDRYTLQITGIKN